MTKHRKPEEWISDILEAAADQIDARGYANLTMDGVAERAGVSKGGLYRFFASKKDLAVAVLRHVYSNSIDFDVADVVARGLAPEETLSRVLIVDVMQDERATRDKRVWLQLLPQALWDPTFAEANRELSLDYERKVSELVAKLHEREGIDMDVEARATIAQLVHIGLLLRDGAAVQGALGRTEEAAEMGKAFIHLATSQVLSPGSRPE